MNSLDELRELQADFEPLRRDGARRRRDLEALRKEFVDRYPPARLSKLTLDEYVQGKGSRESFSYWLERKTADLGHIQGAPAIKFGIFFHGKTQRYKFKGQFSDAKAALQAVLTKIRVLIRAAQDDDLDRIRKIDISPMVKGKLLFLYCPHRFLNIFSERHVDHFLRRLRLSEPGSRLDVIAKKELLGNFKRTDEVMKSWGTFEFGDFLYWAWPPPSRDEKTPEVLRKYHLKLPAPEDTDPEFILSGAADAPDGKANDSGGRAGKLDFEKRTRRNKLIGDQGEDIVLLAERRELRSRGKPGLATRVKAVCRSDDSAGYDILSYDPDGTEKYIEVKSTTAKAPTPGASFSFHLSAREYKMARKLPNYHIYVVFEVETKRPRIWPIPNPAGLVPQKLLLRPAAYYATLSMDSTDSRTPTRRTA